ncbi:hypothetical protein AB0D31_34700, partial [Streptomyces sp. NPDC048361]
AKHGTVLVVVDQPATIGALPLAIARDMGCEVSPSPGATPTPAAFCPTTGAWTRSAKSRSPALDPYAKPPPPTRELCPGGLDRAPKGSFSWESVGVGSQACRGMSAPRSADPPAEGRPPRWSVVDYSAVMSV